MTSHRRITFWEGLRHMLAAALGIGLFCAVTYLAAIGLIEVLGWFHPRP